ncbi:energy transducer TonB [Blastomonas sp. SL216]|uniref:energy transducer TonB n=1 Tax=Blastomonas sp. SL216 TaxID=2995169 RepID=UPI0023775B26|nr:energy transducer TonB [Blastomonas sp. SL216]
MALSNFGRGCDHDASQATLQERTLASLLSAVLTLAIFLGPLLITVERRVAIVGSLQVFLIPSVEGEDRAAEEQDQSGDEAQPSTDPRRPDAQAPEPQAALREPVSGPEAPDPAPITLPDFAQTLNGAADGLVSVAPPVLADTGHGLAYAGQSGAPGTGTGAGGAGGEGGGGAGQGGRGVASVYTASWAPSMNFAKDHKHYPRRAARARVEGVAWLKCRVIRDERVSDCKLIGESPKGYGFGRAALKTEPGLRIQLHDQTGRRVYDEWTMVTSTFTLADLKGE